MKEGFEPTLVAGRTTGSHIWAKPQRKKTTEEPGAFFAGAR